MIHVVSFVCSIAGTLDSFDENLFRTRLAATLPGVSAGDVTLQISGGSVRIKTRITLSDPYLADRTFAQVRAMETESFSIVLGMPVELFRLPMLIVVHAYPPPPTSSSSEEATPLFANLFHAEGDMNTVYFVFVVGGALMAVCSILCIPSLLSRRRVRKPRMETVLANRVPSRAVCEQSIVRPSDIAANVCGVTSPSCTVQSFAMDSPDQLRHDLQMTRKALVELEERVQQSSPSPDRISTRTPRRVARALPFNAECLSYSPTYEITNVSPLRCATSGLPHSSSPPVRVTTLAEIATSTRRSPYISHGSVDAVRANTACMMSQRYPSMFPSTVRRSPSRQKARRVQMKCSPQNARVSEGTVDAGVDTNEHNERVWHL